MLPQKKKKFTFDSSEMPSNAFLIIKSNVVTTV